MPLGARSLALLEVQIQSVFAIVRERRGQRRRRVFGAEIRTTQTIDYDHLRGPLAVAKQTI